MFAGVLFRGHHGGLPADHGGRRVDPGPEVPVHRRPGAAGQRVPDGRPVPGAAGRGPPEAAQAAERPALPPQVERGRPDGDEQQQPAQRRRRPTAAGRCSVRHRRGDHTAADHHGGRRCRQRHAPPAVPGQRLPVRRPAGRQRGQLQRPSLRNDIRPTAVSCSQNYCGSPANVFLPDRRVSVSIKTIRIYYPAWPASLSVK